LNFKKIEKPAHRNKKAQPKMDKAAGPLRAGTSQQWKKKKERPAYCHQQRGGRNVTAW